MASTAPPDVADDSVTASDLARHFGHWQRRALKAPVYVLNHGRPQFVLASIEFMKALSTARPMHVDGDVAQLLDALVDPVLICDAGATVVAAGRAARLHFGKAAQAGATLAAFLPNECATFLSAIVCRVADGGIAERATLPGAPGRARLDLSVEPASGNVVIIGRAAGVGDARDAALARTAALHAAITALPGHAVATIGLRGLLVDADPSLANLTGLRHARLIDAPAAGLFSPGSRPAVRAALEVAFEGGTTQAVAAELLVADGTARPVSLGLAPIRRGLVVEAVQAVIVPPV